MSRYGKSPIPVPKGVEVKFDNKKVKVKGPKGELVTPLPDGLTLKVEPDHLTVALDGAKEVTTACQGLYRSLVNNMVVGVSKGFEVILQMIGVGYRAAMKGDMLDLQVGFSHPTQVNVPKGVKVEIEKNTRIIITGFDKQVVGQFAATVRAKKPPEPYKGKGIRYENEYVRKKAGKAAKGKAG